MKLRTMKYPGAKVTGVYALFLGDKVVYVGGSARCIYNRITFHMWALNHGKHPSEKLQILWDTNKGEGFEWKILETCPKETVMEREAYWSIMHSSTLLNTNPEGYPRQRMSPTTIERMKVGAQRRVNKPGHREHLRERALGQHAAGNLGRAMWKKPK
jgi:hypothetical protein